VPHGKVAIIGAGYAGLSAAYEMAKQGVGCTVFEASGTAGGLAGCVRLGGVWIEKYYHHCFNHDQHLLDLVGELGLQDHIVRKETTTATFYGNRIYRLSSPLDVLRFKPLPLADRFRLGRLVLQARAIRDHRRLEGITAREWITKVAGQTVYDVVWRPLFEGKFGKYADQLSAVWFWGKLTTRGRSRSRRQQEELLYLDGGLQRLTRALIASLTGSGGRLQLNCPVRRVSRAAGAWDLVTDRGSERFDQVLLTAAPPLSLGLIDDVPDELRLQASAVPYLGVTTLMLVLNRPLSDVYWLNINEPDCPFVGLIEHTNLQPPAVYGGRHIAYLTKYRDDSHETCRMGTPEVFNAWKGAVERIVPGFEESWVTLPIAWQDAFAQPVVLAGQERRILPLGSPLPGIWLCSMAQVYPEDRGVNHAVRLGRSVARQILAGIASPVPAVRKAIHLHWSPSAQETRAARHPLAALEGLSPA
jgi:protoporphyrinogen oxidase